jgi:putative phage-type endonuclease
MSALIKQDVITSQPVVHLVRRYAGAERLVDTKTLDRSSWLAYRKQGIGSSDAAAAIGLNPYKSQLELWMEKTGRSPKEASSDEPCPDSALHWGTVLEPIVAEQYALRTGFRVRRVNAVLKHPSKPWMLANLDREIVGQSDVQVLECKTAGINGARLWREGVPEYVQIQVMHQLAVTGQKAADVAVLIGGQQLEIHRIVRDEAMIEKIALLEQHFWSFVERDIPPPADSSDSASQALRWLFPSDNHKTVNFSGDGVLSGVFDELLSTREQISLLSEKESLYRHQIQQAMESASVALFDKGRVSWKQAKDSLKLDAKALKSEHPELIAPYFKPVTGSRRFLVQAA